MKSRVLDVVCGHVQQLSGLATKIDNILWKRAQDSAFAVPRVGVSDPEVYLGPNSGYGLGAAPH